MTGRRAWARWWGASAVAVALGVLELALVRLAGPPGRQLEVLRQLARVGADPLASVLALLALAAQGLAAYLLAVLALQLLALLPGSYLSAWQRATFRPGQSIRPRSSRTRM